MNTAEIKQRIGKALKALAPLVLDGRDAHIYGGLLLLGWGLWSSPLPWLAGVLAGLALWYMGLFLLARRER